MEYSSPEDIGDVSIALDEHAVRPRALVPEKHLDSPITISLLERLKQILSETIVVNKNVKTTTRDPRRTTAVHNFLRTHPEHTYSSIRNSVLQYSDMLDYCLHEPEILEAKKYPMLYQLTGERPERLQTDLRIARNIYLKELHAYSRELQGILSKQKIAEFINYYTPPGRFNHRVVQSASRVQLWSDIVEKYRRQYKTHTQRKKYTIGPVRFVCGDGFLIIKTDELDHWQLMTYEQLQMIQDCCHARHNVELALQFKFHNGTSMLSRHVDSILAWQERVLRRYGNIGFELVKAPEAVFKAWLNSLTDGDLLNYSSYDRTLDKMKEKERKIEHSTECIDALHSIVLGVSNIMDAAELFGLSKLSGHPVVYAEKSLASVRDEALPLGTISIAAVRKMERMFKHMTLAGYLNEHQSWPPLKCPPALDTQLRRHFVNQVTSLPLGCYPLSDLDAIVFDKFVEYDYSEDYLKFLDDKAICPGAREMSRFWYGGSRGESRRLLQKILELEHFDTRQMIERLRRGRFTPDEYVVELTQKERELKTAARCFCKLPFEVRTFFTSTEYNLKEMFMSKYMPQQTMTMSNTETKTRMYNLVKNAKSRNRTLLEVDFSRWNLRWRQTTVQGIAGILEDIFGLPGVFSQAHPFFTKATIVMTDKHKIPDYARVDIPVTEWPESDLVYRGKHLGGFEGIQQALWTLCTIAMMYWVLHDQNVSFMMAGQGDNQIFTLDFAPAEGVSTADQLRRLLAVMELRCSMLNHEVKPDECIDSSTVLTYSKDIYVEGNHILYNLKFASRTFKREEIDMPSLSTEIAAISACSMACADSVYETPRAIFWKTFQTLRFLSSRVRSENYQIEHAALAELLNDESKIEFALLLPGSLGGLPTMAWTRFFLKGEVDDLTWDVAAVRQLSGDSPILARDLQRLIKGEYSPRTPNLTQLILDPHSIPLQRPKDLKRLVKDAVADRILDFTNNRWIRDIFNDNAQAAGDTLLHNLVETEPFYPQIMSDVYSLSPSGVRDALLSRFTMTRTINAVSGNPNFSTEILSANAKLIRFILDRYKRATQQGARFDQTKSIFDLCSSLRSLWGSRVKNECIAVYNPFDFKIAYSNSEKPMITCTSRAEEDNLHRTLGVYPPNFGTKTRQKVSDHGFKITTSSSTVQDLKRLVLIASELGAEDTFKSILSQITHARSPWSLSQLMTVLPTSYGGTAAHRHQAINSSAFSLLGSRTVPTHLNFCSDKAGILSGGEFDFPIAFQEFYLVLTNLFQVLTHTGLLDCNASIGFEMSDTYIPIPDAVVTCTGSRSATWNVMPSNKLVYVSELMVKEIPIIPPRETIPHVDAEQMKPLDLVYNFVIQSFMRKWKLLAGTSLVNAPVELFDMKEFNHLPFKCLDTGLAYAVQTLAIYYSVHSATRDAHVKLPEVLLTVCRNVSPLLTRLMHHPDFQRTQFAAEQFVLMQPGAQGARPGADALAGYLYDRATLSIRSREMLTTPVSLVLFADYGTRGTRLAEAHWTANLALRSSDSQHLLITSRQRLLIATARRTLLSNVSTLTRIQSLHATMSSLATERPGRNHLDGTAYAANLDIKFCNAVPAEAIRALRQLKLDTRTLRQPTICPPISRRTRTGVVTFEKRQIDGTKQPLHTCEDTSPDARRLDSFLTKLTRCYGLYSTAIDMWLSVLQKHRVHLNNKRCLVVGVGHGAASTAALLHGAVHVNGIDLRSSFPCSIQREGTYLPPEIVEHGCSSAFSWSSYVARAGGNILTLTEETLYYIESVDTCIVDIEVEDQRLATSLYFLSKRTTNLIVRIICCDEWARYYADLVGATNIICTSAVQTTHKKSYILISTGSQPINRLANYDRIIFTSRRPFSCAIKENIKRLPRLFNRHLVQFGVELTTVTIPEIRAVAAALQRRALNSDNRFLQDRLQMEAMMLTSMIECYCGNKGYSAHAISTLDARHIAMLAQWIANTNFNRTAWEAILH
jgi:hypothetical protein